MERQTKWLIGAGGLAVTFAGLSLLLGSQFLTPVLTVIFSGAVLAAVVAGFFQILSDRASAKSAIRSDEAAEKAALRQIAVQKKLEAIQGMWKIADQLMREYYFPIGTAAGGLSKELQNWRESPKDPTLLRIFYWFVRFRITSAAMAKKTTFFILTNYLAEKCATTLQNRIDAAPGLSTLELSTLSVTFGQELSFYVLSEKVQDKPTRDTFSNFEKWVRSNPDNVAKLERESEYLYSLITTEMNRMYEQWYGEPYHPKLGQSLQEIAKYLNIG